MVNIRFVVIFSIFFLLSGCATTTKFARVGGQQSSSLFGVKVYMNQPPENNKYKSLGWISAKGDGMAYVIRFDDAMGKLSYIAKEMGANGIINWKQKYGFFSLTMEGEAVIFEKVPED